jgi:hypothetical protein
MPSEWSWKMGNYIAENRRQLEGRHYVLRANSDNYWFNLSPNVVNRLKSQFGSRFCIVLFRDGPDDDAYIVPFRRIQHLLTQESLMSSGTDFGRWMGSIRDGELDIRRTDQIVNVADCHNNCDRLHSG